VRGFFLLKKIVKEKQIQLLQTHLPETNLWGLLLALTGQCKVISTVHNNQFLSAKNGTKIGNIIKRKAYQLMLRKSGAIVTVSEQVKHSLLQGLGLQAKQVEKVFVVNNGVHVPERLEYEKRREVRERFGVEKDQIWLVSAGRLTEAKNFQHLVAAVGTLARAGKNIKCLLAGDGHLRQDLEVQIRAESLTDIFTLAGNRNDLDQILLSADVLAMSSRWEGLPLVLLEGMAAGLPVVGTRINGFLDIITHGREGFLVEVDDVEGLADVMSRLCDDPEMRFRMGENGRNLVIEKFNFQRVYDELSEVYRFVLAQ
jgi:glycosyltransferase involved in cell wall biosynthesis